MEAIEFIKKTHKPFLGIIDNDLKDEDGMTYEDYFNMYCHPFFSQFMANSETIEIDCQWGEWNKHDIILTDKNVNQNVRNVIFIKGAANLIIEKSCPIKSIICHGHLTIRNDANEIDCFKLKLETENKKFKSIKISDYDDFTINDCSIDKLSLWRYEGKANIINCNIKDALFERCNLNADGSVFKKCHLKYPMNVDNLNCEKLVIHTDIKLGYFNNWHADDIKITNTKNTYAGMMYRNMTTLKNCKKVLVKQIKYPDVLFSIDEDKH